MVCANTSSDPISNTSPAVPVTIHDTDIAADTFFAVAGQSIAVLGKRDGTEMSVTGAALKGRSGLRRSE